MDIKGAIVLVVLLAIYAGMAVASSWHTFRSLNWSFKDYLVSGVSVQRSPSSPCGSLRSLTGVHAGLFWDRHQLACRPGAARGRDPASLGAPRLAASSMSSAFPQ